MMRIVSVSILFACVAQAQVAPHLRKTPLYALNAASNSLNRQPVPFSRTPLRTSPRGDPAIRRFTHIEPVRAKSAAAPEIQNPVTLYKVKDGRCSQSTIEDGIGAALSKSLRGFQEGDCASVGFTKADGAKATSMPIIGDIDVLYFVQPPPNKNPIADFFGQFTGTSEDLVQSSNNVVGAQRFAAGFLGFLVGSGIVLAVSKDRPDASPSGCQPMLAA